MINIFISRWHKYTVKPFLKIWPNKAAPLIRLVPYQAFHRIKSISPGLFIFSDIDRITSEQIPLAEKLYEEISTNFGKDLILNNPTKVLSRCQLLSLLWEQGINKYRIYPLDEIRAPERYPVFIRRANDHLGSLTGLIADKESFLYHTRRLIQFGQNPAELIVIEFCDTRGADGLFCKYSAFRVGNTIIPAHILFSRHWVTKDMPPEPLLDIEKEYLEQNLHRDELMRIFQLANIEYGRIDYGLLEGEIQVWEINTNPILIQKHKKYPKDKIPYKQILVDQLAEAFLAHGTQSEAIETKPKSLDVNLAASDSLNPWKKFERHTYSLEL